MKSKIYTVAIVTMFAIFALGGDETSTVIPNISNQRYVMFSPSLGSGNQVPEIFVIDTLTGRVWRQTFFSDLKRFFLKPEPYISTDDKSVSVTPPQSTTLESLSLQNRIEQEVQKAQEEPPKK